VRRRYQVISYQRKAGQRHLAEFFRSNGQGLLPMVELIEQCRLAVELSSSSGLLSDSTRLYDLASPHLRQRFSTQTSAAKLAANPVVTYGNHRPPQTEDVGS
jgi:hypothetical protein